MEPRVESKNFGTTALSKLKMNSRSEGNQFGQGNSTIRSERKGIPESLPSMKSRMPQSRATEHKGREDHPPTWVGQKPKVGTTRLATPNDSRTGERRGQRDIGK